jgi:RecA-family ATPase
MLQDAGLYEKFKQAINLNLVKNNTQDIKQEPTDEQEFTEQAITETAEPATIDETRKDDKTVLELLDEIRPELILNKFYKKTTSIVAGNSGTGKTYIMVQEAMKAALSGKKVCLWPAEDVGFLGQRLKETIDFFKYSDEDIKKINSNLIIHYTVAKPIFKNDYGRKKDDESIAWFIKFINDRKIDLFILDSFNRFSSGLQESMPSEIGEFMNQWHEIALKTNCAVVFLHHLSQAGLSLNIDSSIAEKQAAIRGAGSILATARASYIFMGDAKIANKKYMQGVNVNHAPTGKIEEFYMPFYIGEPELNQTNNNQDEENGYGDEL